MHPDVRLGKLSHSWKERASWFLRDGNHDVRGSGAVNQFVEAVEPAHDGNRIRLGMDSQMAAAEPGTGSLTVAGVHEANDEHPWAGALAHLLQQLPGITTGAHEDDPRPRGSRDHSGLVLSAKLQRILHKLPPIRRSVARIAGAFGSLLPRGTIHGHHAIQQIWFKFSIGRTD